MNCRRHTLRIAWFILSHIAVLVDVTIQDVNAKGLFHIERPRLGLRLSYEFKEEIREGPSINTENLFHDIREGFEIETKGWVYHPALLKYTLSLQPEWNQRWGERKAAELAPSESESRNASLHGYFADVTLLESKPYTWRFFSRRYNSPIGSAFAQTTETETDTYGAQFRLKYKALPSSFSFTHRSSTQTGFYRSEVDRDELRLEMRHMAGNSDTSLDAFYDDSMRTTTGITTRTKTSNSDLENVYFITDDRRVRLDSFLSHRWNESDSFSTSNLRLSERLQWRHRENLRTYYTLNYDKNKSDGFEADRKAFSARLTHRLYENLTTDIEGGVSSNDFTNGSENAYGAALDFGYRREIPWGTINMNVDHDYKVTKRDGTGNLIQVIDERHTLTIAGEFLDHRDVDVGSIVVIDASGSPTYIEGPDYIVDAVGSMVRIVRSALNPALEGAPVLVRYRYATNPDLEDALFGRSYGVNLDFWSTLFLFYNRNHLKQTVLSGTPPDTLIDDTLDRAEVRLDWRWTETRLSYENVDRNSGISSDTRLVQETITLRPARRLFFRFSGRYGERDLKDRAKTEEFYTLLSDIDWAPAVWCNIGLEGYQNSLSGDLQDTVNTGITFTFELSYAIWNCTLEYRFMDKKDNMNGDSLRTQRIYLEIIRTLW